MLKIVDTPNSFHASAPMKISKRDNSAFSLPAGPHRKWGGRGTCPGATKACEGCYAMKGRHVFPSVQQAFVRNRLLLQKLRKNKSTGKAIDMLASMVPRSADIFRVHESGDFYSQWYVDVWTEASKLRPDVMFWAYTRSFELDFKKLAKRHNFVLWASTDEYNMKEAKRFVRKYKRYGVKHAYGPWNHNADLPENSFVCPVTNGKMELKGACEKCMLCVAKGRVKKNVVFLAH